MRTFARNIWLYASVASFLSVLFIAAWFDALWIAALPVAMLLIHWLLFYPKNFVYFVIFITPLSIPIKDIGGGFGLSVPTEPLYWILIAFILFSVAFGKKLNQQFLRSPISLLILFDMLWTGITCITSEMPLISLKFLFAKLVFVGLFYFGFGHFFNNPIKLKKSIILFCISTFFLVIYTLINHAKYGFVRYFGYAAMRPFLPDHGVYAALVAFALIIVFVFMLYAKTLKISRLMQVIFLIMFGVLIVGIVFSFTRAAWVSLVISLVVFLLLQLKIRFRLLLTLGVFFLIFILGNWSNINNELTRNKSESDDDLATHVASIGNISSDPSNLERLNRWDVALEMFRQRPIVGWGPGTYTFIYGQHQRSYNMTLISTSSGDVGGVHSEYLRTISESGFLSALFFLILTILAIAIGFNHFYTYPAGPEKYLHLAIFLALITYFSHGILNNYSDYDKIALPFWGFLGAMVAMKKQSLEKDSP